MCQGAIRRADELENRLADHVRQAQVKRQPSAHLVQDQAGRSAGLTELVCQHEVYDKEQAERADVLAQSEASLTSRLQSASVEENLQSASLEVKAELAKEKLQGLAIVERMRENS